MEWVCSIFFIPRYQSGSLATILLCLFQKFRFGGKFKFKVLCQLLLNNLKMAVLQTSQIYKLLAPHVAYLAMPSRSCYYCTRDCVLILSHDVLVRLLYDQQCEYVAALVNSLDGLIIRLAPSAIGFLNLVGREQNSVVS